MSDIKAMEVRRNELFDDLSVTLSGEMQRLGISEETAAQVSEAACERICSHWGGQLIAVPKDAKYKRSQRNKAIKLEFNGKNHAELARKFGLTQRAIYKVLSSS